MKKLTLNELNVLTAFNYARANWDSEKTKTVSIDYDAEYQDFAVVTSEKNVRKNRISKLQAEITAWAEGQLSTLNYIGLQVKTFSLSYADETLGIELAFVGDEPAVDDTPHDVEIG